MRVHPVAKRYARAFFELADEKNNFKTLYQDVRSFADLLDSDLDMKEWFSSPQVEKSQKISILDKVFKPKLEPLVYQFILLLIKKNRIEFFDQIVFFLKRFDDKKNNRLNASVTSVVPLTEAQQQEVTDMLKKSFQSEIVLENKVDTGIYGGLIVQVEGKIIDNSLLNQMDRLRQRLMETKSFAI